MMSPCWFVLIFAFAAQATTDLNSHYHDLEDLHNELEDYITGLQKLEVETRETLNKVYELEASKAIAKHKENSLMLMRLANQKNCQLPTLMKLNAISESWSDRFSKCMNLTQKLVYYENVTVAIYEEYLEIRPLFCDGANTVSLCLTDSGSLFDKFMCSYQGIESSVKKFDSLKEKILGTVRYIQKLVKETTEDILGCFGIQKTKFLLAQNDLIQMSC